MTSDATRISTISCWNSCAVRRSPKMGAVRGATWGATRQHSAVMLVDRTGQGAEIAFPAGLVQRFKLSPDGRAIALDIDNANASIWIGDLARATATRLTLAWSNNNPVWAPDGFVSPSVRAAVGLGTCSGRRWMRRSRSNSRAVITINLSPRGLRTAGTSRSMIRAPRPLAISSSSTCRRVSKERSLIQTPFDEFGGGIQSEWTLDCVRVR